MAKEEKETARKRRARTSKFVNHIPQNKDAIGYEVIGIYEGNPNPQPHPMPNLAAALSRYAKIAISNPALQVLQIVEHVTLRDHKGNQTGKRANVIHQFVKLGQEFASNRGPWWETAR